MMPKRPAVRRLSRTRGRRRSRHRPTTTTPPPKVNTNSPVNIPKHFFSYLYIFIFIWWINILTLFIYLFILRVSAVAPTYNSRREEEAAHQEAVERVHALHEGDAGQSGSRMHAQRERRHQPNPRPTGKLLSLHSLLQQQQQRNAPRQKHWRGKNNKCDFLIFFFPSVSWRLK